MKAKKFTQIQRISRLEKAVANLSILVQAIIDKINKDEPNKD